VTVVDVVKACVILVTLSLTLVLNSVFVVVLNTT